MSALQDLLGPGGLPSVADMRDATAADLRRHAAADARVGRIVDPLASHEETFRLFQRCPGLVHLAFNRFSGRLPESMVERDARNFAARAIWGRAFEVYHRRDTLDARAAAIYAEIGAHVRHAPAPFNGHVFADGLATVNLESDTSDRTGGWRIAHPEVVADLRALFVRLWQWSDPLLDRSPDDDVLVLLRLLAGGRTTDEAAAELGVSELVYRRRVRDLVSALGAPSTFAAGALARRRGLLDLAEAVA